MTLIPPTSAAHPPAPERFTFGDFYLDLHSRQLFRNGVHIPITTKAFDTLFALVRRKGELVSKDELISEVWPDTFVSEDSLTQNISSLRRLLEDDPTQPHFIATVARRGYRFISPVSTAEGPIDTASSAGAPAVVISAGAGVPSAAPEVVTPARAAARVRAAEPWAIRWVVAGVLVLGGVGVGLFLAMLRTAEPPAERRLRFIPELPSGSTLASGGVVSPDGRHVAFIARDRQSGETKLWIRALSTATTYAISGSDGALRPFWSPDSRSIAFFGGNRIRRATLTGGAPVVVCDTVQPRPSGATWNARGQILFGDARALFLVSAEGGEPRPVLEPSADRKEISVGWPQFLPGGTRFLYEVSSSGEDRTGVFVGSLDQPVRTKLVDVPGTQVAFTGGYLIYVRDGRLFARRFDPEAVTFQGDPFVVVDGLSPNASVSASTGAVIAFGGEPSEELTQFDRQGRVAGTITGVPALRNLSLSPDRRILVGEAIEPGQRGLWQIDLTRQVSTRVNDDGSFPLWLPDGQTIAFAAAREPGPIGLYLRDMNTGSDQLLARTEGRPIVSDTTADGQTIAYTMVAGPDTRQDIWTISRRDPANRALVISSPAREIHPEISPDGRWIAYASDEGGSAFEVYIDGFPNLGHKKRVSTSGGTQPQWRADGMELFYLSADQTVMSVSVTGRQGLELATPLPLFRPMLLGLMSDFRNQYVATPDGQTFFAAVASQATARDPITVIVNWRGSTD